MLTSYPDIDVDIRDDSGLTALNYLQSHKKDQLPEGVIEYYERMEIMIKNAMTKKPDSTDSKSTDPKMIVKGIEFD